MYSLDNFVKYFLEHDKLNYARVTTVHLAGMTELENMGLSQTKFQLQQNFSSLCCFCFWPRSGARKQSNESFGWNNWFNKAIVSFK